MKIKTRADDHLKRFEELTGQALRENDVDKFIELLLQRDMHAQHLVKNNIEIDKEEKEKYLFMENEIIRRLEEERKNLLKEMECLSKNKKAIRTYSPKFPFPPMPVFFEKKG